MTSHPDNLTERLFVALYPEFDLIKIGMLHIVVPAGAPLFAGDSLGAISRQIGEIENPETIMDATAEPAEPLPQRYRQISDPAQAHR